MTISDRFAVSLVSLALLKRGYRTYKNVPPGIGAEADLLAVGHGEKFAVEISVLAHEEAIPHALEHRRKQCEGEFGVPTYFAFLVDRDTRLLVDPELHKRMLFSDEEVTLDELELQGDLAITSK